MQFSWGFGDYDFCLRINNTVWADKERTARVELLDQACQNWSKGDRECSVGLARPLNILVARSIN